MSLSGLDRQMFQDVADGIAVGIEAAGILIIVTGAVLASAMFLNHAAHEMALEKSLSSYRANLCSAIPPGLEFLVAAGIVGTVVVEPTSGNVGVLALIIAIRTFLSFTLEVEIDGHRPWQRTALSNQHTSGGTP